MNLSKNMVHFFCGLFFLLFIAKTPVHASIPTFKLISTLGAYGVATSGLITPSGISIGPSGDFYITDWNQNRVQKFNSSFSYIGKVGTYGTGNGQFKYPYSVEAYGSYFYVADNYNNRIERFNADLTWSAHMVTYGNGVSGVYWPTNVAVGNSGEIYVADGGNNRIQKLNSSGALIWKTGVGGTGNGQFNGLSGIAVDSNENIYTTDNTNKRVQKFDSNGNFLMKFGVAGTGPGQLGAPGGIDVDSSGNIYVIDTGRLMKFNSSGTYLDYIAITGASDIFIDNSDFFYVTNAATNYATVKKYDLSGYYYQISGIGSSLDVIAIGTTANIENGSSYGLVGSSATPVRIKTSSGRIVSDAIVTLSTDADWSSVTADSDLTLGKAFVSNLIGSTGVGSTHTLYVPAGPWAGRTSQSVRICPSATSFASITSDCVGGVSRAAGSYTESFGNIVISKVSNLGDGKTYWKITGLTGTGGEAEFPVFSGSGSGTSGDPYQITTCLQLQELKDIRSDFYQLMNNIDCSDTINWNSGNGFIPIGYSTTEPFTGTFTGNSNYVISDLYIKNAATAEASAGMGLFGTSSGANITQVHLTNIHYVANGSLITIGNNIGGVVGLMIGGTLANCTTSGLIERTNLGWDLSKAGGVIGELWGANGIIKNSSSSVGISAANQGYHIGGFVGRTRGGPHLIEDSYATGFVGGGEDFGNVGGFIGLMAGQTTIRRGYSTGAVNAGKDANTSGGGIGGFAGVTCSNGYIDGSGPGYINDSYSTSNVTVDGNLNYGIGGFVGSVCDNFNIDNSYASGIVSTHNDPDSYNNTQVGGFAGYTYRRAADTPQTITNCRFLGTLNAGAMAGSVGGFIGDHRHGSISDSYSTGHVNVYDDIGGGAINIGGFAGVIGNSTTTYSSSVSNCYSTGNISHLSGIGRYFGGFVGYINSYNTIITKSYSTGNVEGYPWSGSGGYFGGFVGYLSKSSVGATVSITNTYARGNVIDHAVNTNDYLGGYAGNAISGAINYSYSTGSVTSTLSSINLGGFAGGGTAPTTDSYWDYQLSGVTTSSVGSSYTTAQMKTQSNFPTWDFSSIWSIQPAYNDGYPSFNAIVPTATPTPTSIPTLAPTSTPAAAPTPDPAVVGVTVVNSTPQSCNEPAPVKAPDLFKLVRKGTKVTLYYTPVNTNTTGYTIMYGYFPGDERFNVSYNQGYSSGALSFDIGALDPKQNYTFWVRAFNQCVPGPWSNYLSTGSSSNNNPPAPTPTAYYVEPTATPKPNPKPTSKRNPTPTLVPVLPTPTPTTPSFELVFEEPDGTPISGIEITITTPSPSPTITPGPDTTPAPTTNPEITPTPSEFITPTPSVKPTLSDKDDRVVLPVPPGDYIITVTYQGSNISVPVVLAAETKQVIVRLPPPPGSYYDLQPKLTAATTDLTKIGAAVVVAGAAAKTAADVSLTSILIFRSLFTVYQDTRRSLVHLPIDFFGALTRWLLNSLWSIINNLSGFIIRRRRISGTIFDALTNKPLPNTFIIFYSASGKIFTDMSDQFGHYFVRLNPGKYLVRAAHDRYNFPSKIVLVSENDVYEHIYLQGKSIEIRYKNTPVEDLSVPLDPLEIKSRFRLIIREISSFAAFAVAKAAIPLTIISLLVTGYAALNNPTLLNKISFAAMVLFTVLRSVKAATTKYRSID